MLPESYHAAIAKQKSKAYPAVTKAKTDAISRKGGVLLDGAMLAEIATRVSDISATDPTPITGITIGEMGDGSRRAFALVHTYDALNDLEQTYRVSSPARWDSPEWASEFEDWRTEVQVGDGWLVLS